MNATLDERLLSNGLIVYGDVIASGTRVLHDGEVRYNWALLDRVSELERVSMLDDNQWNDGVGALPGTDFAKVAIRANRWHTLVIQRHGFNI